jgi:UDP-N-acetyl-D-mannosaminuronic acid transferase (WecB/TagA/CpsF family)
MNPYPIGFCDEFLGREIVVAGMGLPFQVEWVRLNTEL